jgi:hypothetical protein
MNENIMKGIVLSSLVFGALVTSSFNANAAGFNKEPNNDGTSMSSTKFYEVLAKTKPDQLASNFGIPDQIQTLRGTKGEVEGIIWIYHDAVLKQAGNQDARFILIAGEMKYVSLSKAG